MILFGFTVFLCFIGDVRCFYGIPIEYFRVCRTHEDDRTQERVRTNENKKTEAISIVKNCENRSTYEKIKNEKNSTHESNSQFTFLLERKAECDARSAKSKHELFQ